jgi:hypothetical protein
VPRLKDPTAWFQMTLKVSQDPATSAWLKDALIGAINREDPVSAAKDAEILHGILQMRAANVQRGLERSGTPVKSVKPS